MGKLTGRFVGGALVGLCAGAFWKYSGYSDEFASLVAYIGFMFFWVCDILNDIEKRLS